MNYKTILFDIDGTLCDPGDSIIESARFALAQLGVNETDEKALRRFVGPPLEHVFKDNYGFDDATVAKAVEFFRLKHKDDAKTLYKAYPGIAELVAELSRNGKTLAIVTSKIDTIAKIALEGTGLLNYFTVVGAQQADKVVKKEEILAEVLTKLGATDDTSTIVMVGDRMHDVEAAKEHGIDSIGVLWGYGTLQELQDAGATHTVANAQELRQLLL